MLSATLDTSCALNFLGEDDATSDALVDAVAAAMAGRVNLRVTEQAFEEVARTVDEDRRRERLTRLRTFGRVELPSDRQAECDALADQLHQALFPAAQAASRTNDHNRRDCLQLAKRRLVGRDLFVTRDDKLHRRVTACAIADVVVVSPEELVARLAEERRLVGFPRLRRLPYATAIPTETRQPSAMCWHRWRMTIPTSGAG